jgi:hypothetical protein
VERHCLCVRYSSGSTQDRREGMFEVYQDV